MAITIGSSNISSLQAQKSLSDATSKVSKAYQQLSSGLRINQASDDAAGLAIATGLDSKARIYTVGVRNVNDAISASTIAEGALISLKDISQRQLELAEQAANGTYSTKQRSSLNKEANALVDEYNRIVSSTTFNGLSLFDPKLGSVLIQAGNSTLTENFGGSLSRAVGNGTFVAGQSLTTNTVSSTSGDFNGDGILDILSGSNYPYEASISIGNGDGTFQAAKTFQTTASVLSVITGDLNGDGKLDFVAANHAGALDVFYGNGNSTFSAPKSFAVPESGAYTLTSGDLNGDGKTDLIAVDNGPSAFVLLGNGDGTFEAALTNSSMSSTKQVTIGDFNNDGIQDFVTANYYGEDSVFIGNGNGTFHAARTLVTAVGSFSVSVGDFNEDGITDIASSSGELFIGNGDGTFQGSKSLGISGTSLLSFDFNGDGYLDVVGATISGASLVALGNGNGTFQSAKTIAGATSTAALSIGDFNRDGRADLVLNNVVYTGQGASTSSSQHFNLNSQASARAAFSTINVNLDRIESQLGSLGATGSRFQTALNNLQTQSQNFEAASSRIQDADIAQQTSVLVRTQILQQAATSVLAQANQQPSLALKLLA